MPSQVLLQSGSGPVAAGEQELRGAAGGAVNQPHRQLQDGRAGDRGPRGGQVSRSPHFLFTLRLLCEIFLKSKFSASVQKTGVC